MSCSNPICERPCQRDKCPREEAIAEQAWYRARRRGKVVGPYKFVQDMWLATVDGDVAGGWPPGADECRDAGADAAIDQAECQLSAMG